MGAHLGAGWTAAAVPLSPAFDPYRRMPALVFGLLREEQPAQVRDRIAQFAELLVRDASVVVVAADDGAIEAALREERPLPARAGQPRIRRGGERVLGLPLAAHGVHLADLELTRHDARPLAAEEQDALRTFAELAAVVLHTAHMRALLRRLASTDELTGIANRRRVLDELHARAASGAASLLFVDFDGLKAVNDDLGYDAGDELVQTVARALDEAMLPGELAGRLGGDELVALMPTALADAARERAVEVERALDAIGLPPSLAERYRGASVGVATLVPGESADDLLRRAGAEMRARKRARKGEPAPPA